MNQTATPVVNRRKPSIATRLYQDMRKRPLIYIMLGILMVYFILFCYWPMYGTIIAFKKYKPRMGIMRSAWVGFQNFQDFFSSVFFGRIVRNTVLINVYLLVFGFPIPIIFAVLLNEVRQLRYKKLIQTVTYLPHFISTVVICSMITQFTNSNGFITTIVNALTGHSGSLIGDTSMYRSIYVASEIWQTFGWNSILYIAAMTGISVDLYEAAHIDGANKFRQIWHVTLPGIGETIIIMLILACGKIMSVGWEKTYLLQSPLTYETSDIISTYVYRKGFEDMDYSYSTAVNVFNSVVNLALLMLANRVSNKLSGSGLW